MRNWLALLVVIGMICAAAPAWGLGFGDLEIRSALGQPLRAEIQLLAVSPEHRQSLAVDLASPEDYQRFGVHRTPAVGLVQLQILPGDRPNRLRIQLTSRKPIREPFVRLLLEARWAGNRALRAYTLLLDPPGQAIQPSDTGERMMAGPSAGSGFGSATVGRPESRHSGLAPDAAADGNAGGPVASTQSEHTASRHTSAGAAVRYYGPVGATDTLWAIAKKTRPSADISMYQMMLAIFQHNIRDFGGNINALHEGSKLKIPPAASIRQIDAAVAAAEIHGQMASFTQRADGTTLAGHSPAVDTAAGQHAAAGLSAVDGKREAQNAPAAVSAQTAVMGNGAPVGGADGSESKAEHERTATTAAHGVSTVGAAASTSERQAAMAGLDEGPPKGQSPPGGESGARAEPGSASSPADTAAAAASTPATGTAQRSGAQAGQKTASIKAGIAGHAATGAPQVSGDTPRSGWTAVLPGAATLYTPRRLLLAVAILVLIVCGFLLLVRRHRSESINPESVRLQPDIRSQPADRTESDTPDGEPAVAEAYSVEDMLEDADVLIENHLYDDALATLSLGVQSHPGATRLLHKRLEAYWRAGDRSGFVAEAKRIYPEPKGQDAQWREVAAWGRQLAPDEAFFAAPVAGDQPVAAEAGMAPELTTERPESPDSDGARTGDTNLSVDAERDTPVAPTPSVVADEHDENNNEMVASLAAAAAAAFAQTPDSAPGGSALDGDGSDQAALDAMLSSEQDEVSRMQAFGGDDLDSELSRLADEIPGWEESSMENASNPEATHTPMPEPTDSSRAKDSAAFGLVDNSVPLFEPDSDAAEVNLAAFAPDALSLQAESGREDAVASNHSNQHTGQGEAAETPQTPQAQDDHDRRTAADSLASEAVQTKLDLARVYLDMGEDEMAAGLLAEVQREGDEQQCRDAVGLLESS